jgi:hypothetical protein
MMSHQVAAIPLSGARRHKRVLVVYRHALLRDLVARLLTDAGADVVGQVSVDDVDPWELTTFDADVVVLDEAAVPAMAKFDAFSRFNWVPTGVSKIISVGVGGGAMVAFSRHFVDDASVEQLIGEALDLPTTKPRELSIKR